jgi:Protein of unknown function (DUF2599)
MTFALAVTLSVLLAACNPSPAPSASDRSTSSATSARAGQPSTPISSPTPAEATTSATSAGAALIDHVQWGSTDQGRQLRVYPTAAGRADTSAAGVDQAWSEVLAAAPDANTPGMHDQFECHWVFARLVDPTKTSWNLEPWRPDVGYQATVAARCNPGGPED